MSDTWTGTGPATCPVCGVEHETEGTWTEGMAGIHLETPKDPDSFEPGNARCPECLEFGGEKLPDSPCCADSQLRGYYEPGRFSCLECESTYPPAAIRTYALGLEVERIVRECPTDGAGNAFLHLATLTLRAAASLGIRRA